MPPIFLVDLDDTLIDSQRFKADFFAQYALAVGFDNRESQQQIWQLYSVYRRQPGQIVGLIGFGEWLKKYFSYEVNVRAINEVIKSIRFEKYLLPEAKKLIDKLQTLGKVVLWTSGSYEEQGQKVTDTGLNLVLGVSDALNTTTAGWQANLERDANSILIDPQKTRQTEIRLGEFREVFPENPLIYIDNSPGQVTKALSVNDSNLRVVWVNTGNMQAEIEERSKLLEEKFPAYSNLAKLLEDFNNWTTVEGTPNSGLKGKKRRL